MDSIFVLLNSVEESGGRRRAAKREQEMRQKIKGVDKKEGSGMELRKKVHLTSVTKSQLGPQLLQVLLIHWDCFLIYNMRC